MEYIVLPQSLAITHETWKTHQLAPEIYDCSFEYVNLTHSNDWYCTTSYENSLRWMTKKLTHDKHRLKKLLGAVKQKAIIWTKVDQGLSHHMLSFEIYRVNHCHFLGSNPPRWFNFLFLMMHQLLWHKCPLPFFKAQCLSDQVAVLLTRRLRWAP